MQSRGCDAQRGACLRNQVGDFFDVRGRSSATRTEARSHGSRRRRSRRCATTGAATWCSASPRTASSASGLRTLRQCGCAGARSSRANVCLLALTTRDARGPQATPGAANWRLMLESAQTHSTVVTLNIRADDIVWTQNVCVRARPARAPTPHATTQPLGRDLRGDCEQVRAERGRRADHGAQAAPRFGAPCATLCSRRGHAQVIVINNGQCRSTAPDCQAQFTVGVPDCSSAIRPIQARTLSLRPNDPTTLSFILQAETDLYAPGSSYYCHGETAVAARQRSGRRVTRTRRRSGTHERAGRRGTPCNGVVQHHGHPDRSPAAEPAERASRVDDQRAAGRQGVPVVRRVAQLHDVITPSAARPGSTSSATRTRASRSATSPAW